LLLLLGFGAFIFLNSFTAPVSRLSSDPVEFMVSRGDSVPLIARHLYEQGLIRSPLGFRWVIKKDSLGTKLQSGIYRLTPDMSTQEIAVSLTRGIADLKLVIPEGFRLEEIAATAEAVLGISQAEFLAEASGLEGRLFPDTYHLAPTTSAKELVELLHNNFQKRVGEIDSRTLILASLVERETKRDAEKPIVAGILNKRLDNDWPLELDATIQYVLGDSSEWWPNTTLADRRTPSPYNTYLNPGLPPGPIANPGLAAVSAARNPQASPYWFYLHTPDGQIYYGETLVEHNANIESYLR
jgi:UPF0755 protein